MKSETPDVEILLERAGALAVQLEAVAILESSKAMAEFITLGLDPTAVERVRQTADAELSRNDVRKRICDALKTSSDDLREVTKVIGAALLPLIITGTITLPATPLGIAVAALIIYRAGLSAYCAKLSGRE